MLLVRAMLEAGWRKDRRRRSAKWTASVHRLQFGCRMAAAIMCNRLQKQPVSRGLKSLLHINTGELRAGLISCRGFLGDHRTETLRSPQRRTEAGTEQSGECHRTFRAAILSCNITIVSRKFQQEYFRIRVQIQTPRLLRSNGSIV